MDRAAGERRLHHVRGVVPGPGVTDCEFDLMAYSLERLELDILMHARYCHPGSCAAVDADPDSPERRALGSACRSRA